MACLRRIKTELNRFQSEPPPGISLWGTEEYTDDCYPLKASIQGPDDTPYENGLFYIDIHVPQRYPFVPPNVRFDTPIYHPNIDDCGRICLDILNLYYHGCCIWPGLNSSNPLDFQRSIEDNAEQWKACLNIESVLSAIQRLMAKPNFSNPLMTDIANEFLNNPSSFEKHAKEYTLKYAIQENTKETLNRSLCMTEGVPCDMPETKKIKLDYLEETDSSNCCELDYYEEIVSSNACEISCDPSDMPETKEDEMEVAES